MVARWIRILLAALVLTAVGGCEHNTLQPEVEYKPVLLPIKFTIDSNGVSVSGETKLVTPIGEFSINVKRSLTDRPSGAVYVIIRDKHRRKAGTDDIYLVRAGGDSIKVYVDGRTEIEVKDGQVVIDVTHGDIKEIKLARMDPVGGPADDNIVHAWWAGAGHSWNAGWVGLIYHPFMLTRWAYDDSTVGRWFGLGFGWFLLRLFLAVILSLVDVVFTIVFLVAQLAFYFWGPTGRNIIWGLSILLILIFATMVTAALRA